MAWRGGGGGGGAEMALAAKSRKSAQRCKGDWRKLRSAVRLKNGEENETAVENIGGVSVNICRKQSVIGGIGGKWQWRGGHRRKTGVA